MKNDILAVKAKFIRALGNGTNACEYLATMAEHVANSGSGDTTVLAYAFNDAVKKKDTAGANAVKLTVTTLYPGAKKATDKKTGLTKFKTSGIALDKDGLERVKDAAKRKLSIRHAPFRKALKGDTETVQPAFIRDPEAWAKAVVSKGTKAQIGAAIAALQAKHRTMETPKPAPDA